MSTNIAVGICVFISIPFLWTFFSKFFKLQKKTCCSFLKNIYLDESSLHQQPLFWLLITLPVIVSIVLWSIISSEYKLEWTANGYAGLIKYSQLPLMMLALSPILGAFVISAHRSLQTFTQINATNKQIDTAKKQLVEAQNKNKIDLYYSERKNRFDLLEKISNIHEENIARPISLYMKAFYTSSGYNENRKNLFYFDVNNLFFEISNLVNEIIILNYNDIFYCYMNSDNIEGFEQFEFYPNFKKLNDLINKMNDCLYMNIKVNDKILRIYNENFDKIKGYMQENIFLSDKDLNDISINMLTSLKNEVKNAIDIACDIGLIFSNGESEKDLFSNFKLVYKAENDLSKKINKLISSLS